MKEINVLGARVSALNINSAVSLIEEWLRSPQTGRYVWMAGVHGVMEGHWDSEVRRAHNAADAALPDGMPLAWIGHLLGHRDMDRVYGPDLMLELIRRSIERRYTHFFYGGKEGVAETLQQRMEERFPGVRIVGTWTPPFGEMGQVQDDEGLAMINDVQPDLLWVGMSTPKQELQMDAFRDEAKAKVMIGVGAAFDFHTGLVKQAPRWMQRGGLEWLYRMSREPRRLGRRYLRCNPAFLFHLFCQATRLRRYPLEEREFTHEA